jgi:hypothetical protein
MNKYFLHSLTAVFLSILSFSCERDRLGDRTNTRGDNPENRNGSYQEGREDLNGAQRNIRE